jgi:endogenous inhibitor of DNA gyrase (YacG/DUF329 family)
MAGLPTACVLCRARPIAPEWRPFCSERCKLQDLARWADGSYAVAGDKPAELEREEGEGEGENEK